MAVSKYDVEVDLRDSGTSHAMIVDLVGSNKRVLDVGCSTGYLAKLFGAHGNKVAGIEYDAPSAEVARTHADPVIVGDLELDDVFEEFADESFDVIVFGDVLEHLRDPLPVLRRARQLLAPGGCVVISVPNIAHGDVRLALLGGRFEYSNVGLLDVTHLHFFTRDSLRTFLRDSGFVAVDVRSTRAELFHTELGVHEADYPAEVVRKLRQDADSTTYQFVVRAVKDDGVQAVESLAWRLSESEQQVDAARATIAADERALQERDGRIAELERAIEEQSQSVDRLERSVDGLSTEVRDGRSEIDRINATKVMRSTSALRRVYGKIRSAAQ